MRTTITVLFLGLIAAQPQARAQECAAIADSVDVETAQLSEPDQNVVGLAMAMLERANGAELAGLVDSLKLEDQNALAFWSEVLKVASVYAEWPDCQVRLFMMSYYSDSNHMRLDEECNRFLDEEYRDWCWKPDPTATARFERAATYLEARYASKYKCHCEGV